MHTNNAPSHTRRMLERWLQDGVLEDAYGEFMVQAHKVGLLPGCAGLRPAALNN